MEAHLLRNIESNNRLFMLSTHTVNPSVYATENVLPVISGQHTVLCCSVLVKWHQVS